MVLSSPRRLKAWAGKKAVSAKKEGVRVGHTYIPGVERRLEEDACGVKMPRAASRLYRKTTKKKAGKEKAGSNRRSRFSGAQPLGRRRKNTKDATVKRR